MKINKKRIACFALASALVIPGAIGLAGCEKGHTHAFTSDPFYEIVTEDGVKTARSWRECSCGAEDAHKKVENAKIVSADTEADNYVQKVLDGDISNKTIVFDAGDYNNIMSLRSTRDTATVYAYLADTPEVLGDELDKDSLDATSKYNYSRTINNVVFAGTEGANIKNLISADPEKMWNLSTTYPASILYDYVRDISSVQYVDLLKLSNITFTRLNFSELGRIRVRSNSSIDTLVSNITVQSCNFVNDELLHEASAIFLGTHLSTGEKFTNFTFKNNHIEGYYQGIETFDIANVEILNSTFKSTEHNAISILTNSNNTFFRGNITIKNNSIDGCLATTKNEAGKSGERAIRLASGNGATIVIENNSFKNCVESYDNGDPAQILKTNALTDCSFSFKNNTYEGVNIPDVVKETGSYANVIVSKP